MSEDRPHEWAYAGPPVGKPSAAYANGTVLIYVGSAYRSMSLAQAQVLLADLTLAVDAGVAHAGR